MQTTPKSILALDVGERRIGVAMASSAARLAHPMTTLLHTEHVLEDLRSIVARERVETVVIGLPRGLDGQTTAQTRSVQAFARKLAAALPVQIRWQDEALTSVQAEAELQQRGGNPTKAAVDALAATLILEDFLRESSEAQHV